MPLSNVEVKLVTTTQEFEQVQTIRREVFMNEGSEPETEQFDGYDFCATHLLATLDGEPVGTMRLRLVSGGDGGTIIWERFSILRTAREKNPWIFRKMLNTARLYTRKMNIGQIIGIVENPKLMKTWKLYGAVETHEDDLVFRGHKYKAIRFKMTDAKPKENVTLRAAVMRNPNAILEPTVHS